MGYVYNRKKGYFRVTIILPTNLSIYWFDVTSFTVHEGYLCQGWGWGIKNISSLFLSFDFVKSLSVTVTGSTSLSLVVFDHTIDTTASGFSSFLSRAQEVVLTPLDNRKFPVLVLGRLSLFKKEGISKSITKRFFPFSFSLPSSLSPSFPSPSFLPSPFLPSFAHSFPTSLFFLPFENSSPEWIVQWDNQRSSTVLFYLTHWIVVFK